MFKKLRLVKKWPSWLMRCMKISVAAESSESGLTGIEWGFLLE
jgi:hypothetical protein